MSSTTLIALIVADGAGVTALVLLLLSIRRPDLRIWPPPRVGSVQWILVWGLTIAAFGGIVAVGVLEWNAWGLSAWLRWGGGLPLIAGGNVLAWWGVKMVGVRNATGAMEGGLARDGLYRFTRNPQYLGDLAILAGWSVLAASTPGAVAVIPSILCFLVAPIPEERALLEKFGAEYERYREDVPRFL